jgi:putative spermidine/putrescine transport system permease protein
MRAVLRELETPQTTTRSADLEAQLQRRALLGRIFSYSVMIVIVVAILAPLVPILIWAFSGRWLYPHLLPEELSLRAWKYVFSPASKAGEAALKGGVIAIVATLLSLLIGIPAGRALGLHNFRGKGLVQFLILAPVIVPGLAVLMGIHVAFIRLGLAGNLVGVTLAHLIGTTPYVVMVMSSVFSNYDPEFEEQARTLGAGPMRTFMHVTLPTIFPGLLVAGMFAFIISWGQYIVTLLISGGQVITVPLLLVNFANSSDKPVTAALCLVFLAPSILIIIITSKYLTGENAALGGFGA